MAALPRPLQPAASGAAPAGAAAAAIIASSQLVARGAPATPLVVQQQQQQQQQQQLALRSHQEPSGSPRIARRLQGTAQAQALAPRAGGGGPRGLLGAGGNSGSSIDGQHSPRSPASIVMHSNPSFLQAASGAATGGATAPDVAGAVPTGPPSSGWTVEEL